MEYPIYKDLAGRTVFITGGGSGIGAAFVEAFASQGANVSFVSLSTPPAEAVCDRVEAQSGARPLYIPCDVRDIEAIKGAVRKTREKFGPISILINNAARDDRHEIDPYSAEDWDNSLSINLRPHFFTVQACLDDLKANSGSIINLGSNSAILGLEGYASYVTAKAGIVGLTKALARELGPHNVRANVLVPGWVLTDRQKELWATPEAIEECLAQQSLKRTIEEADIANAALFLASSVSAMMTGQSMIIDGGRV